MRVDPNARAERGRDAVELELALWAGRAEIESHAPGTQVQSEILAGARELRHVAEQGCLRGDARRNTGSNRPSRTAAGKHRNARLPEIDHDAHRGLDANGL